MRRGAAPVRARAANRPPGAACRPGGIPRAAEPSRQAARGGAARVGTERERRRGLATHLSGAAAQARMSPAPGAEPPLVVYDDLCGPCASFASAVASLAGGRIPLVGHHTALGRRLREQALGGDTALDMFWVVEEKAAHGGRSALLPLLRAVMTCGNRPHAGALARPARGGGEGCDQARAQECGCRGGPSSAVARTAGLLARPGRSLQIQPPRASRKGG